jgi:hypothetical protein
MVEVKLPPELRKLWHGELPLPIAFWRYLITYDLTLNLVATIASLSVVLAQGPIALAALLHLLPVPYSVLATIGTWRSASRYGGNPDFANAAKIVSVFWVILMLVF